MPTLEELASNEVIKQEYKKTFLLNLLKKLICRMKRDANFKRYIRNLYLQSTDKNITTRIVLHKTFSYDIDLADAETFNLWLNAHFNKSDRRKEFTEQFKRDLYDSQKGLCAVCGEPLGKDFSKIHVDHIIPWALVGDEINDNYQYLCSVCNECKSCHTDYIFKNLLNLA